MTIETKTTIEPRDITTLEFECNQCHSVNVLPLDVAATPPVQCPHCRKEQWMTLGGELYRALVDLVRTLQRFKNGSEKEPFAMRFGLSVSVPASGGKD
jgi:hypothetical protein